MLSLLHSSRDRSPLCNGTSRREFLQIGALGLGGLTLSQLLAAESQASATTRHKAVIMIYLVGGPPHQDLWDLKPDAPAEIAGPMRPINTNVPGMEICELLPQLAARADRLAIIRSIADAQADHDAYQVFTGRTRSARNPAGDWPQFASAAARILGTVDPAIPAPAWCTRLINFSPIRCKRHSSNGYAPPVTAQWKRPAQQAFRRRLPPLIEQLKKLLM